MVPDAYLADSVGPHGIGSDAVWLYLPESCLSVPVSAASTLPRESHFQRLARSAWWRGKRLRPESWRRAWPKAAWMTRLSGLTLKPSTAKRGVASWIRSLRESPASLIPSLANGKGPQTSGTCGPTPCESSEMFSPATSSLRTSPASLGTCPKGLSLICSGTGGECLDRFCLKPQASELRTEGSGCSSWPTPRASEEHQGHETEAAYATGDGYKDCGRGATLSTVTAAFSPPAPQAATGQQSSETPPGSRQQSAKRRLNPYFVEWLQGMPAGFTVP
jgi:hypothetical protein